MIFEGSAREFSMFEIWLNLRGNNYAIVGIYFQRFDACRIPSLSRLIVV